MTLKGKTLLKGHALRHEGHDSTPAKAAPTANAAGQPHQASPSTLANGCTANTKTTFEEGTA